MARSRQDITQKYERDIAAAEGYRESDPEKYANLRVAASDERAAALDDLTQTQERDREISDARGEAAKKFPLADADLISGSTTDEIMASAEKLQKFAERHRTEAEAGVRKSSRALASQTFRGNVPGGDVEGSGPTEYTREQYDKEIRDARGNERETLAVMRRGGKLRGLDMGVERQAAAARERAEG
jgi:hypothetical protein